jgi:putative NIF3 family GTP cyclohydrolase 1 type 2
MGEVRAYGVHFLAGAHYASDTFGIRRLGELVAQRFSIEHQFIDVPNPI